MKTTLLIAAFAVSALFCHGQNLPMFENFSSGLHPDWTVVAGTIHEYNRNTANATCVKDTGLATNPSVGSSGGNKTGIRTDTLQYVQTSSIVTVSFKSYAYKGHRFDCEDQLFSDVCTAYGQVSLYSIETNELIGRSDTIPLNLTITGQNSISAVVTAPLTTYTEFYVLLDISYINCSVNGSKRVIIDDILITATAGGPLPVNFRSFTANRSKHTVSLNWTTSTEQNSRGFNVQRNIGNGWETIAFVSSKALNGNSSNDLNYTHLDVNAEKGISQYRIVQVDLYTNRQMFSETRSIKGEANSKNVVFPNPTPNGNTNLLFNDDKGARSVSLIDPSGRTVKQWTNVTTNSMQLNDLKAGFYYLKIINPTTGEQSMERIVVK